LQQEFAKERIFDSILQNALEAFNNWMNQLANAGFIENVKRIIKYDAAIAGAKRARPHMLVVDSLNVVEHDSQKHYFEQFLAAVSQATKMVIFVLDSSASSPGAHEIWEYVADTVIRLDHHATNDYYVQTIEIVKSRYQGHILGKHQIKIYHRNSALQGQGAASTREARTLTQQRVDDREGPRRDHPYREEGGIFIYPSIHYYLSTYKRRSTQDPKAADTKLRELNAILKGEEDRGGFPQGRCTAFIGPRGGHKSHLGYLHLLHRISKHPEPNECREAALVISLREDEKMTRKTMTRILHQEFPEEKRSLSDFETTNQLEILYYHPGYITPEEFFHRMFISIQRLKQGGSQNLTVLFNSLDQLASRFPLCAKQEIFIPGIIETLSGEEATSIFITVDEPGQPPEQYGLLAMADLILSFQTQRFSFNDYYYHMNEAYKLDQETGEFRKHIETVKQAKKNSHVGEVVLQVVRFAGGQRAGARGLLELVDNPTSSLYLDQRSGLHFTPLSLNDPPEAMIINALSELEHL
jgi:hypothetical protein